MKKFILTFICILGISIPMFSQTGTTKIYLFFLPSGRLTTTSNPDNPIRINKCTLLETNMDSLGLEMMQDKKVYLHFEAGRTYYYQKIITNASGNGGTAVLSECTEQEFWFNAYFSGVGTYRHYFLDKQSGLKLLEEKHR